MVSQSRNIIRKVVHAGDDRVIAVNLFLRKAGCQRIALKRVSVIDQDDGQAFCCGAGTLLCDQTGKTSEATTLFRLILDVVIG